MGTIKNETMLTYTLVDGKIIARSTKTVISEGEVDMATMEVAYKTALASENMAEAKRILLQIEAIKKAVGHPAEVQKMQIAVMKRALTMPTFAFVEPVVIEKPPIEEPIEEPIEP